MFFFDGIMNVVNKLINKRDVYNTNQHVLNSRLSSQECLALARSGLGRVVIKRYINEAFNDIFDKETMERDIKLINYSKEAMTKALVYGTGYIVCVDPFSVQTKKMTKIKDNFKIYVTGGDLNITPVIKDQNSIDLALGLFTPSSFSLRGLEIDPSRVLRFKYEEPEIYELPTYFFGGISMMEILRNRIVDDDVIARDSIKILTKLNNIFYKIKGLNQLHDMQKDDKIVQKLSITEDMRSEFTATLLDADDDVINMRMTLAGVGEIMTHHIKRVAMHFNIPISILLGEKSVSNLGASGDSELKMWTNTISTFRDTYLREPMRELWVMFGKELPDFQHHNFETKKEKLGNDSLALDNSTKMENLGVDSAHIEEYIKDNINENIKFTDIVNDFEEEEEY